MRLEGSCNRGSVRFSASSLHPCPCNLCYCSIYRKPAGGDGFAVNLGALLASLGVAGEDHVRVQHSLFDHNHRSPTERHFCGTCVSALWVFDPRWPKLQHPFAAAIDTPLPVPPEHTHWMLASRELWVEPAIAPGDRTFDSYPLKSIAAWHDRLDLTRGDP